MKQLLLFSTFFIGISLGFGQESKINPAKIIDKDIIQNNLTNYKIQTDSILNLDAKNPNAYRISAFIDIIRFNFSSGKNKIQYAIKLDSVANNRLGLSEDYNIMARYYKDVKENDSALFYYKKSLNHSKELDSKIAGRVSLDLSGMYSLLRKKDSAMIFLKSAKEYSIKAKDTFSILEIERKEKNLLAKRSVDRQSAFNLYKYSLKKDNNFVKAIAHDAMGKFYMSQKDSLQYAKKHLDSAISFFKKTKNHYLLNILYPSRAHLASRLNDDNDKPIGYYKEQYKMVKGTNHIFEEMTAYNLASQYQNSGDVVRAENIYLDIIKSTKEKNIQPLLSCLSYSGLSKIYKDRKEYKKALEAHENFKRVEDEIYSTRIADQANKYKVEFETEKKEKENLQLKAENAEQALLTQKANNQKWLFALGLFAALISAFFIWRRYKSEAKAKQIISEQKDEIEKQKNLVENLQKELHHRLKNNLSFIDLFINLAKGRFTDKAYQTKLNELQNRMRSMFEVHKQLFKKDDVTSVKAKTYIDALVQNVNEAYAKDNISVINTTSSNENILADTSFPVGLIINEFITNSYKYAFEENDNGLINIALTSDEKQYQLSLKDNGKGLPKEFNINDLDSFGLETIQLLTKEYGGTFAFDGANGVSMNITLPKNAA